MRKRKGSVQGQRRVLQRRPSSLIDCPGCGKRVCDSVLGVHLDTDCPSKNPKQPQELGTETEKKECSRSAVPNSAKAPTVAHGKFEGGKAKPVPLTREELYEHSPCEVHRNALPLSLADALLQNISEDAKTWVRGTWWMFGKDYTAPRSSAFYTIVKNEEDGDLLTSEDLSREVSKSIQTKDASEDLKKAGLIINQIVNDLKKKRNPQEPRDDWGCTYALANWYQDGADSVGAHSDRMTLLGPRPVIASLSLGATRTFRLRKGMAKKEAGKKANQALEFDPKGSTEVKKRTSTADSKLTADVAEETVQGWKNGETGINTDEIATVDIPGTTESTGFYSESSVSELDNSALSHGTRTHNSTSKDHNMTALQHPGSNTSKDKGELMSVDIPLPHNTLVIMWPPCQEEWRHEVPRCSNLKFQHHPLSGTGRLNLTFRMLRPEWAAKVPQCRCRRGAIMKARVGADEGGRTMYYYSCDTTQGKPCGYFEWVKM